MATHLKEKEIDFVQAAGLEKIKEASYHFVRTHLAGEGEVPDKGHPVFKAMKAIGADNRESLEREFNISRESPLSELQIDMIVENAMGWIRGEVQNSGKVQAKIAEF